jgi:hypothetical protein
MSSYPALKYSLFNLEALDVLLTGVIHSATPFQQRLTLYLFLPIEFVNVP